jgi:hypothetical protein
LERISAAERDAFFRTFRREALHLETRDVYGTEIENEPLRKWRAGAPDDLGWFQSWLAEVRQNVRAGKAYRRVRLVSEPVSDYIRFEHSHAHHAVEVGEDIRWLPRRLASGLLFPGNDVWIFDREVAAFTVFSGTGEPVERLVTRDPSVLERCTVAFEAAWQIAIPHNEYKPA